MSQLTHHKLKVIQLPLTCNPAAVLVLMAVTLFDSFSERFLFWQKELIKASGWWWRWWEREGADQAVDGWGMLSLTYGVAFLSAMVFWLSLQGTCVLSIFCLCSRSHCSDRGATLLLGEEECSLIIGQMKLLLPEAWTPHTSCVTPLLSHNEINIPRSCLFKNSFTYFTQWSSVSRSHCNVIFFVLILNFLFTLFYHEMDNIIFTNILKII